MSGNSLLLDTNIILLYLAGEETLLPLLEENNLYISVITEMELLAYPDFDDNELDSVKKFIGYCTIKQISDEVKEKAIQLRRNKALKLPDAIILATAFALNIPFVTADKDFQKIQEGKIILFER